MPWRTLLFPIAVFFAFAFSATAQQPGGPPAPRKIDEFGDTNTSSTKARLDNLAIQLQNDPEATGFIIVYRTQRDNPGISSRLLGFMRRYMLYTRGFTSDRIVTIDGGPATNLVQEFWLVPPGATPPIRSDAYTTVAEDRTVTREFDDYAYPFPGESEDGGDFLSDSLPGFAGALQQEPKALGYVIAYAQCEMTDHGSRRYSCDPAGTAARMLGSVRAVLSGDHGVAATRIKIVNGGYRKQRSVELWIVPAGEHAPIATPNAFPPRRRRSSSKNHFNTSAPVDRLMPQLNGVATLQKIDEFGELKTSDIKARLDVFLTELQSHPASVGSIVAYRNSRDLPGRTALRLSGFQHYLVETRGVASDDLVLIDGGTATNAVYELWVGERGVRPPLRADAVNTVVDLSAARKFDDDFFALYPWEEGEDSMGGSSLPAFAAAVKNEPYSRAYIIGYLQYSVTSWRDRHGRVHRKIQKDGAEVPSMMLTRVRKELTKNGVVATRIVVINGGYRKQRSVELWIVPSGAHRPIATPNAFPPRRRK